MKWSVIGSNDFHRKLKPRFTAHPLQLAAQVTASTSDSTFPLPQPRYAAKHRVVRARPPTAPLPSTHSCPPLWRTGHHQVTGNFPLCDPKGLLVAQSCLTLYHPTDCRPPASVHGIFQPRILEWVATSFSRRSSWPRDRTWVSHTAGRFFTVWATRKGPRSKTHSPSHTVASPLASPPHVSWSRPGVLSSPGRRFLSHSWFPLCSQWAFLTSASARVWAQSGSPSWTSKTSCVLPGALRSAFTVFFPLECVLEIPANLRLSPLRGQTGAGSCVLLDSLPKTRGGL